MRRKNGSLDVDDAPNHPEPGAKKTRKDTGKDTADEPVHDESNQGALTGGT